MDPLGILPYWINLFIWFVGIITMISEVLLMMYLLFSPKIPEIDDHEIYAHEHEKSDNSI